MEEQGTGVVGKEGFDWGTYALSAATLHTSLYPTSGPAFPFSSSFILTSLSSNPAHLLPSFSPPALSSWAPFSQVAEQ